MPTWACSPSLTLMERIEGCNENDKVRIERDSYAGRGKHQRVKAYANGV